MPFKRIVVLLFLAGFSGCSSNSSTSDNAPAVSKQTTVSTSDTPAQNDTPATASSSPQYDAVIVINAARKGEDGPFCESDMAATGKSQCGPKSSLTTLSWEFTDHHDGADHYKFQWTLTSDGKTTQTKGLTVEFDGNAEATVIDAEHHIFIRKAPLNPKTGQAG